MSDTSNMIEFDVNENKSSLDNHTSNSNDVLNASSDKRIPTVGSPEFALSTPMTVLENNNAQNETSKDSCLKVGNLSGVQSKNFDESFKLNFSTEAEATKIETFNSLNTTSYTLLGDIDFNEARNISTETLNNGSLTETKNHNFFTSPTTLSLDESLVGHANSSSLQNVAAVNTNLSENFGCVSDILPDFKGSGDNPNNFFVDNDNLPVLKEGVDMNLKTIHELSMSSVINPPHDFEDTSKSSESVADNKSETGFTSKIPEKEINLLEDFHNTVSTCKVPENATKNTHEFASAECVLEKLQSPASNTTPEFNDVAFKVPEMELENTCEIANTEYLLEKFEILPSNTSVESIDVACKEPENVTKSTHEFANAECSLEKFEIPASNTSVESKDVSANVPESFANNKPVESAIVDFAFKVPESSSGEDHEFLNTDLESKLPVSPAVLGEFANVGSAVKESENPSTNASREFVDSENKVPKNSTGKMYDDLSNDDFMFKVPENPISKVDGKLSDDDFMFKVPEDHFNNPMEQFTDADFGFKIPKNPPTNECDEEFTDAVQFFKDPNSFQFLENIKTSSLQTGTTIPRSSLYVNFDPLHSKLPANVSRSDNCELISAAVKGTSDGSLEDAGLEIVNRHLADVTARESLGNILISFDSPKPSSCVEATTPVITSPPKRYTEDELQQQLKMHELTTQELYLKKQREMESEIAKRDDLSKVQRVALEELLTISAGFAEEAKKAQEKIESLETDNKKLREDLKTSTEDLQSVENTFADFHKRYEQCKGMLKTYKENEEHLRHEILDFQTKEKEQKQMYRMLQERTEEMLEKANGEVASVKRAGEAQVAVLKAQLKKAELKISGLESDIKQIKIENSQLGGICDDLMAKVSET